MEVIIIYYTERYISKCQNNNCVYSIKDNVNTATGNEETEPCGIFSEIYTEW